MKIVTILGTRPEIIRLTRVIAKLDELCDHLIVHTGQNYDPNLNEIFFSDLNVRPPDRYLGVRGETFGEQIGKIIAATEQILRQEKPDRLLLLGDTNSSLAAIPAKRLGIPVYHMEAGNRCYDDRVPEEVNRRIIDHCSDVLMPYTERSRANLLREGLAGERIFVTGNPILEVINHYHSQIDKSDVLQRLKLEAGKYFLVTMHREENVDVEDRLRSLLDALDQIQKKYEAPVVCSVHPRTRKRMEKFKDRPQNDRVMFSEPFGFFDFINLEQNALCVLSDSGTVQEECCIFHVPNVTLRDVTERPETIECGSNILAGVNPQTILQCVHIALSSDRTWTPPAEYMAENVSGTVTRILLSY